MSTVLLKNVGIMISGNIEEPVLNGDSILIEEGKIKAVGQLKNVNEEDARVVIDCAGTTVAPGLIDSHCHPACHCCRQILREL
jgi:enamidase